MEEKELQKTIQDAVNNALKSQNTKEPELFAKDIFSEVSEGRKKIVEKLLSDIGTLVKENVGAINDKSPILDIITNYTGYSKLDIPGGENYYALNIQSLILEYMSLRGDEKNKSKIKKCLSDLAVLAILLNSNYLSNY